MILTDIIKIHQDFIILWLGLDMHDFATYILKCIDTCIWWLFNFVCVGQSSHSVYIFSVSCFFLLSYDFPYCVHIVHTQVVCQIDSVLWKPSSINWQSSHSVYIFSISCFILWKPFLMSVSGWDVLCLRVLLSENTWIWSMYSNGWYRYQLLIHVYE